MTFAFIRRDYRTYLLRFLICAFLLMLWQASSQLHVWNDSIIPSPKRVALAFWQARDDFWPDLWSTVLLIMVGIASTVILAFLIATALHLLPRVNRCVYWLFILLQTVPLFPIAPILFYLTGPQHIFLDQVITVVLAAFFPILVTTAEGLERVDPELIDLFDTLDATRWQKLLYLEIPNAMHMVIAGAKITVTMCVIGAYFAETLVGNMKGLGFRIKFADDHMNVSLVFAGLLLLALVSACTYWTVSVAARLLQPWQREEEQK